MSFEGKQAIVTGAGSGIGAAPTPVPHGSMSPTRRRCRPPSTRWSIVRAGST